MSSKLIHPIKAILFDLDGTLVHSSLNFNQIRSGICCPEKQDVLEFVKGLSPEKRALAEQVILEHELRDAYSSEIIPGAADLLKRLTACGIKTGIVTRNSNEATQIKVKRCGLNIEKILTREDAPAKPNPNGLLQLSSMWGFLPKECIYVGDYLYDIQAAINAKMHSCFYFNERQVKTLPLYINQADFICRDFNVFEECVGAYLRSVPNS